MNWFSVKEITPSPQNQCTLYIVNTTHGVGVAHFDGDFKDVILSGNTQWNPNQVTHWMPLPDSPKKDK